MVIYHDIVGNLSRTVRYEVEKRFEKIKVTASRLNISGPIQLYLEDNRHRQCHSVKSEDISR